MWFLCFPMAHKTRKPRVTSCHMTSYNSCDTEFYFSSSKNFPPMTFPINHLNNLWSLVRNQKRDQLNADFRSKLLIPFFISWQIFQKVRSLTVTSSLKKKNHERSWPKMNIQFHMDASGPRSFILPTAIAPLVIKGINFSVRWSLVLNSENIAYLNI